MSKIKKKNNYKIQFFTLTLLFIVLYASFSLKNKIYFFFDKAVAGGLTDEYDEDSNIENEQNIGDSDIEQFENNLNGESDSKQRVENGDDILVVVNKKRYLDSNYKPSDLVVPNVKFSFDGEHEKRYMRREAAYALEELFGQAYKEGIFIYALSGYRSYNTQERIFRNKANKVGEEEANKLVARPGESEHHTGLAMDITSKSVQFDLKEEFGNTKEGIWVKNNAHKFGFIIRYEKGKEDITGYNYEPWHIRYVGKEVAEKIYKAEITLEEYINDIKYVSKGDIRKTDKEEEKDNFNADIENSIKEFRAAWVSTVYNLDWPSKKGLSEIEQKQEFIHLLDGLKKAGLNAVIVQIKPSADSFYPSKYAPWSEYLTGVQGQNPGYNPLSFMIQETHKRGMEFHAWFNPYRVSVKDDIEKLAKDHPARKNPSWVVSYGGKLYYNPAMSEVRQFVTDSILEVVKNYNIDGVHLDDYFYPYPEKGIDFPDDEIYKINKRHTNETKEQWRRNNINDFIKHLYKSIKIEKPNVKFGVSPFGIWRNKDDDINGSNSKGSITSYDSLYADTKYWIENEWLDYIAPQIYWHFGYDKADYNKLVDWWINVTKGHKTQLYIGHAAYKLEEGNTPWGNPLEIINQIQYNRATKQVEGSIFFRAKSIVDNPLGLMDKLENDIYKEKAKTP